MQKKDLGLIGNIFTIIALFAVGYNVAPGYGETLRENHDGKEQQ